MTVRTTAAAAAAVLLAACGGTSSVDVQTPTDPPPPDEQPADAPAEPGSDDPSPDVVDDPDELPEDEVAQGGMDERAVIERGAALLGMSEQDLSDDVRVAVRGDETFVLTDDFVEGRRTVDLQLFGDTYRVVRVEVETQSGVRVFEAPTDDAEADPGSGSEAP